MRKNITFQIGQDHHVVWVINAVLDALYWNVDLSPNVFTDGTVDDDDEVLEAIKAECLQR